MKDAKTLKNKLFAIVLVIVGLVPTIIDHDATALIFLSCIALPLFFAKENWLY